MEIDTAKIDTNKRQTVAESRLWMITVRALTYQYFSVGRLHCRHRVLEADAIDGRQRTFLLQ